MTAFGRPLTLEFSFSSRYNATNALAALAAYHALGLPLGKAGRGARHVQLSRLRGEEVSLPEGGILINDCYNANPLSMAAALEHLAERAGEHRKVAVLGDMAELGPGAASYHREVGAAAALVPAWTCSSRSVRLPADTSKERAASRRCVGPRRSRRG